MKTHLVVIAAVLIVGSLVGADAVSHSGGTNANGCHTNRKTGEYHCHNRKRKPPGQVTYCHVIDGESRCGYALSTCSDLVSQFGGRCRRE